MPDRASEIIKRVPDGFDLDQPGKTSYARREAGCREVMLVGDKRLVLMREFGPDPDPSLDSLLARAKAAMGNLDPLGAMQALQWTMSYPARIRNAIDGSPAVRR